MNFMNIQQNGQVKGSIALFLWKRSSCCYELGISINEKFHENTVNNKWNNEQDFRMNIYNDSSSDDFRTFSMLYQSKFLEVDPKTFDFFLQWIGTERGEMLRNIWKDTRNENI